MTPDIYEALVGADYSDSKSQMALAEALRRMRGRGETAMTAPGFDNIGAKEVADSADFAKTLGTNQRMRDIAAEQREARLQGLALSRAAAEGARREAMNLRREGMDEKLMTQLSAKLQQANIPRLTREVGALGTKLSTYKDGDIPGIGAWDSLFHSKLLNPEGQNLRANLASVANQLLKMDSGLAVTNQEYARFLESLGTNGFISESTFRQQLPNLFRDIESVRGNIEAGYPERVRREFYNPDTGADRPEIVDPFSDAPIEDAGRRALAGPRPLVTEADIDNMTEEQLDAYIASGGRL